MLKAIWKLIYKIVGWKIEGNVHAYDKAVLVVAPHTSNWDFFVGLGAKFIGDINSHFLIKKSWMDKPVLGWILKILGGVPVDRAKRTNVAQQMADYFGEREKFMIAIAPEGTRKYVPKLKTGFWHIAKEAKVPLIPITFDYPSKTVKIFDPFQMSENKEEDIESLKEIFRTAKGRNPEQGIV